MQQFRCFPSQSMLRLMSSQTSCLPQRKFRTYQDQVIEFIATHKTKNYIAANPTIQSPRVKNWSPKLAANELHGTLNRSPDMDQVLVTCSSLLQALKGNFASVGAYDALVLYFTENIKKISPENLPSVSYYCSLSKKNPLAKNLVKRIYSRLKEDQQWLRTEANIMDVSMLAHVFFMLDVKINSRALQEIFASKLAEHLETESFTPMLIPVIKILRISEFHPDFLVQKLVHTLEGHRTMNLAEASHTLALLADSKVVIRSESLLDSFRRILQENRVKDRLAPHSSFYHPAQRSRGKDFARFLWAVSCLVTSSMGDSSSSNLLGELLEDFNERMEKQELQSETTLLADIALSFACLGLYPKHLLTHVLTSQFLHDAVRQLESLRLSRLALFLVCVKLEKPEVLPFAGFGKELLEHPKLPLPDVEKELKRRPLLRRAFQQALNSDGTRRHGKLVVTCRAVIPHLNIAGIIVTSPGTVTSVEILDSQVCLRNRCLPDRLMSLKMRLLPRVGYLVAELTPEHIFSNVPILSKVNLE